MVLINARYITFEKGTGPPWHFGGPRAKHIQWAQEL
jgi:hypothetical protein